MSEKKYLWIWPGFKMTSKAPPFAKKTYRSRRRRRYARRKEIVIALEFTFFMRNASSQVSFLLNKRASMTSTVDHAGTVVCFGGAEHFCPPHPSPPFPSYMLQKHVKISYFITTKRTRKYIAHYIRREGNNGASQKAVLFRGIFCVCEMEKVTNAAPIRKIIRRITEESIMKMQNP